VVVEDVVMEEEVRLVVDVAPVVEVIEVTLRVAVVTAELVEVALAVEVLKVKLRVAEAPASGILFRILSHLLPG
jgi:hypothetical protein